MPAAASCRRRSTAAAIALLVPGGRGGRAHTSSCTTGKSDLEWVPLAGRSLLQRFNLASGALTPLAIAPGSAAVSTPPLLPRTRKGAADTGPVLTGNSDRPLDVALERVVVSEEDQVAAAPQRPPAWRPPSKALAQTSELDEEPKAIAGHILLTHQAGIAARSMPKQEAVQHGLAEAVNASRFSVTSGIWARFPGNLSESGGAAGFPLSEPSSPGSRPMQDAFYWLLVLVRTTSSYCLGLALKGSESAWQIGRLLAERMPGVNLERAKLSLARLRAGGADGTTMAVVTVVAVGVLLFGVLWACSGSSEALSGRPRERHATQRQTRMRNLTLGPVPRAPQLPSSPGNVSPRGLADAMSPQSSTSPRPKEWGDWGQSRRTTYKPTFHTEQLG